MKEKFNEKVIPVILKFINTKAMLGVLSIRYNAGFCQDLLQLLVG